MKSPHDQIPTFFDISFQKHNYRIFVNDDVTYFKYKQHGHIQRKRPLNKINKPDTTNDLHQANQHSEKLYEAEAIHSETAHSGSNTENGVTLKSTPSSTPASTAETELADQTEDVLDTVVTLVSTVPSLSTITTVVQVHKSTETETHSSMVKNTESQSDSIKSATDHPSVSTESNDSVITKRVEKCINTKIYPKTYNKT